MKKIILILSMLVACISLSGCSERDLPHNGETTIPVGNFSGEIILSGEDEAVEEQVISFEKLESYYYEEDDKFAKTNGDGIEKYQIVGLADEKKEKLINDKLTTMYEEMIEEYKTYLPTEYLPSLTGHIMFENDDLISFCISRKWLSNNVFYVNDYYTIDKKTAEVMELADFYDSKVGYLTEISEKIYNEFESRKEQFKIEYGIDDNYFFDLTEEDFYDNILFDQESFYISENKELVYYFQKYEIGPGVIGPQEFVLLENIEF